MKAAFEFLAFATHCREKKLDSHTKHLKAEKLTSRNFILVPSLCIEYIAVTYFTGRLCLSFPYLISKLVFLVVRLLL